MRSSTAQAVLNFLRAPPRQKVVVMPDYFVDRVVTVPERRSLTELLKEKIEAGGGSIHHMSQVEVKGGNAVNLGYALAKLGVRTEIVTIAEGISKVLLQESFRRLRTVKLRIREGRPGYTVALESREKGRVSNVMLSDLGDIAAFGPELLDDGAWKSISSSTAVAVVNWAANQRGTQLARAVFERARKDSIRFLDPADFSSRSEEFAAFLGPASDSGLISHLSVNENEARQLSAALSTALLPRTFSLKEVSRICRELSDKLSLTVDVHTPIGSASASGGEVYFLGSRPVEEVRVTGAGDVWDAADIFGYMVGMPAESRLLVANTAAALYVSNRTPEPPSRREVASFIEKDGQA